MENKITREDFEKIYQETYEIVLKFAIVKCRNFDNVNDIIQDTYLELLKIIKKKKTLEIKNINNYLCGIESNIIKRYYSKKKKDNNIVSYYDFTKDNLENEIRDDFDMELDFINKNNVEKVWNYLKQKDLMTTKIFYLHYALGLKIPEISKELEMGESNIKNRIYRTIKELKIYLGKDVI